jgi:hypothetical protein
MGELVGMTPQENNQTASFRSFSSSPYRSAKHSSYFDAYDLLFEKYVGRNIVFLEVGVLDGGSLFMWRDFFGPQARIIGVDLNPDALKWANYGFEIYIGDQSNPEFWGRVKNKLGNIDVVLDDGGHTYLQQISTLENLAPIVNDGGLIVVEDTHTSYMNGFGKQKYSFMRYTYKLSDQINRRFGAFNELNSQETFHHIQIFESIVALHIDRSKARQSWPVENHAGLAQAVDFRHEESPQKDFLQKLRFSKKLDFSSLALSKKIVSKLEGRGIISGIKLRKFFE